MQPHPGTRRTDPQSEPDFPASINPPLLREQLEALPVSRYVSVLATSRICSIAVSGVVWQHCALRALPRDVVRAYAEGGYQWFGLLLVRGLLTWSRFR
jgi:hypothetical protein